MEGSSSFTLVAMLCIIDGNMDGRAGHTVVNHDNMTHDLSIVLCLKTCRSKGPHRASGTLMGGNGSVASVVLCCNVVCSHGMDTWI